MEHFAMRLTEQNGHVVSVFCDDERPDTHLSGFIRAFDEEQILINHISPDGYYDGYILIHMADVHRIDSSGKYELKIERLYQCRHQSHTEFPINDNLYISLLQFCQREGRILSAEVADTTLSGFLLDFDEETVHMQLVSEYGEGNGETIVRSEEIVSFAVDTMTEQNMLLLYEQNHRE